jgi:hypothetical protein
MYDMSRPIIGQEAVCPDGLGRVRDVGIGYIQVDTYYNNRSCKWGEENVQLVELRLRSIPKQLQV